jgi:hypothetical protein
MTAAARESNAPFAPGLKSLGFPPGMHYMLHAFIPAAIPLLLPGMLYML